MGMNRRYHALCPIATLTLQHAVKCVLPINPATSCTGLAGIHTGFSPNRKVMSSFRYLWCQLAFPPPPAATPFPPTIHHCKPLPSLLPNSPPQSTPRAQVEREERLSCTERSTHMEDGKARHKHMLMLTSI